MANVNSMTVGNTTLPVANSLASLSDTNTLNAATGNILTFNGTAWTNGTLTGNSGVSVSRNGANYTLTGDAAWAKTQAISAPLTGLNNSLTGFVAATDTVVQAFGKLRNSQTALRTWATVGQGTNFTEVYHTGGLYFSVNLYIGMGYISGTCAVKGQTGGFGNGTRLCNIPSNFPEKKFAFYASDSFGNGCVFLFKNEASESNKGVFLQYGNFTAGNVFILLNQFLIL